MSEAVALAEFDRYRLVEGEDCGVGLECRDCPNGGRPIAYYDNGLGVRHAEDPAVENVSTAPWLSSVMARHENRMHTPRGQPAPTA